MKDNETKALSRSLRSTGHDLEADKRQVQRFFGSKKFNDDAVRLYNNLSTPIYVVPVWKVGLSRTQRPVELRDAHQLAYYGVSQERCEQFESARRSGAAVFVPIAAELKRSFLPTPWMIVHAMFDSRGGGMLDETVGKVTSVLEDMRDGLGEHAWQLIARQLTMKSARDGVLDTRDDIVAEIMTQAVLTQRGFAYRPGGSEAVVDGLERISSLVQDVRARFEQAIRGRIIEVDTFLLQ